MGKGSRAALPSRPVAILQPTWVLTDGKWTVQRLESGELVLELTGVAGQPIVTSPQGGGHVSWVPTAYNALELWLTPTPFGTYATTTRGKRIGEHSSWDDLGSPPCVIERATCGGDCLAEEMYRVARRDPDMRRSIEEVRQAFGVTRPRAGVLVLEPYADSPDRRKRVVRDSFVMLRILEDVQVGLYQHTGCLIIAGRCLARGHITACLAPLLGSDPGTDRHDTVLAGLTEDHARESARGLHRIEKVYGTNLQTYRDCLYLYAHLGGPYPLWNFRDSSCLLCTAVSPEQTLSRDTALLAPAARKPGSACPHADLARDVAKIAPFLEPSA